MIKKTLLVTLDFPPAVGGVSTYWKYLSAVMPVESWTVLTVEGSDVEKVDYTVYRRKLLSSWTYPRWISMFFHILDIVRREKPSVIVVGQVLPVGTVVWLLSYILHIPYVVSTHGMDVVLPMSSRIKSWLCRMIFTRARYVVTVSRYTAEKIKVFGVEESRIAILPGCPSVDVSVVDEAIPFKKDGKIILTVGRLVKRKGHEDILRALVDVVKIHPDVRYVIVGDGPNRAVIENLARDLGVDKYVTFTGEVSGSDMMRWLATCDVFAMTPRDINGDVEGFGLVYLEANVFGKPVVATRSGGVSDAVVDGVTGVLVGEGDVSAIAGAISGLLSDRELAIKIGKQGRERVLRDFQWEVQGRKLRSILNI